MIPTGSWSSSTKALRPTDLGAAAVRRPLNRVIFIPEGNLLKLFWACCAEAVGTYLMVAIGTGVVAAAVITGAHVGLWQVAMVWGPAVTLAIYVTAAASGAHLNPAVTLVFEICRPRDFPAGKKGS